MCSQINILTEDNICEMKTTGKATGTASSRSRVPWSRKKSQKRLTWSKMFYGSIGNNSNARDQPHAQECHAKDYSCVQRCNCMWEGRWSPTLTPVHSIWLFHGSTTKWLQHKIHSYQSNGISLIHTISQLDLSQQTKQRKSRRIKDKH